MSTSDQPQLTRKQLREARLTGSTPIVTAEEAEAARQNAAAAAAEVAAAPAAPEPAEAPAAASLAVSAPPVAQPDPAVSAAEAPVSSAPQALAAESLNPAEGEERLTRRQMREQERVRTGALPIADPSSQGATAAREQGVESGHAAASSSLFGAVPAHPAPASSAPAASAPEVPATPAVPAAADDSRMITDVPRPSYPSRRRSFEPADGAVSSRVPDEQDGVDDAEQDVAPVPVSAVTRSDGAPGRGWQSVPDPADAENASDERTANSAVQGFFPPSPVTAPSGSNGDPVAGGLPFGTEQNSLWADSLSSTSPADGAAQAADQDAAQEATATPTVNPGFGERVLEQPPAPQADSFDALVGDSTGSHHAAPNALIFQQAPAALSLSGPVASTGEILVTGSYELPSGFGSRGHADGVADGKEVDAVLVDGELAPASSPTPIAASAAIGTIKPAGEVIRPPEPEKGNKLMLALTITAGALAVALVGALIVAITTGALS